VQSFTVLDPGLTRQPHNKTDSQTQTDRQTDRQRCYDTAGTRAEGKSRKRRTTHIQTQADERRKIRTNLKDKKRRREQTRKEGRQRGERKNLCETSLSGLPLSHFLHTDTGVHTKGRRSEASIASLQSESPRGASLKRELVL